MSLIRNLGSIGSMARNSIVPAPIQTSGQRAVTLVGTQGKKVGDGYQVAPTRNGANGVAQDASGLGRGVTAMAARLAPVAPLALTAGCDGDVASTLGAMGLGAVLFAGTYVARHAIRKAVDQYVLGKPNARVDQKLLTDTLEIFKKQFVNDVQFDKKLIVDENGVGVKLTSDYSLKQQYFSSLDDLNLNIQDSKKLTIPKESIVYYKDGKLSSIKLGKAVESLVLTSLDGSQSKGIGTLPAGSVLRNPKVEGSTIKINEIEYNGDLKRGVFVFKNKNATRVQMTNEGLKVNAVLSEVMIGQYKLPVTGNYFFQGESLSEIVVDGKISFAGIHTDKFHLNGNFILKQRVSRFGEIKYFLTVIQWPRNSNINGVELSTFDSLEYVFNEFSGQSTILGYIGNKVTRFDI